MDGLKLKHVPPLGLGDWEEVNSHSSGHNGGSNAGSECQDAILGQAQDT